MHEHSVSNALRSLLWLAWLPGVAAVAAIGCGDTESSCTPGESAACACPSGDEGAQVCAEDGAGFETCECDSGAAGRSSGGAGRGSGGASGSLQTFGDGEYAIELSDPEPGIYCWYIEETDRICNGERDQSYSDICIADEEDCLGNEPPDSEVGSFECSTRVSYVTVGFAPLYGDCDKLDAYWSDDPSVECLYHRHCGQSGTCVDYQCVCPEGVSCDPSAPGGGPGAGGGTGGTGSSGSPGSSAGAGPGGSSNGGASPGGGSGGAGSAGAPDGPPGGSGGTPGGPGGPGSGAPGTPPSPPG